MAVELEGTASAGAARPGNADLERLVVDPERQMEARSRLRDALDSTPRTTQYKYWLDRLPEANERFPVALLSSFTLETIDPFFHVEAFLSQWRPAATYIQYGQWQNALLAATEPGEARHRAVAVLVHDAELLGADRDPAEAVSHLETLLLSFRQRSPTPLFLGVVEAPPATHAIAFGENWAKGRGRKSGELRGRIADLPNRIKDLHLIDLGAHALGGGEWFDSTGYFATHSVFLHRALPFVARQLARSMGCLFRPRRKVLVLDLDNTLWGGVVGEDGVDGVAIGEGWPGGAFVDFQRQLQQLRSTGTLLAIVSKNEEADARAVFEQRPEMALTWNDFSAFRVNWTDKATNIAEIAGELGLGLDSFVFADDSPIECALVRQALPQVEVVELGRDPSRFMNRVLRTQAFDVLHVSAEDRQRAQSYSAEAARHAQRAHVTDLQTFLVDCDLRLSIQRAEEKTLERIHQLIGKTNQFNFTLERPSKEALDALARSGDRLFSASLSDRFGDYGLIGILHLDGGDDATRIANMALSCRALGRGVEDALLAFVRQTAVTNGNTRIDVTFVRGPRNQQVLDFLDRSGFMRREQDGDRIAFCIDLEDGTLPWPAYVRVALPSPETNP